MNNVEAQEASIPEVSPREDEAVHVAVAEDYVSEGSEQTGFLKQIWQGLTTPMPDDISKKELADQVVAIAWPAMLESFLLHLASMVNTMMVGGLGTWAIASIGYCTQPRFLILAVFQAFNTGSTALIARAKGGQDYASADKIMHQSVALSLLVSIVFAAIGYFFAEPMVVFMGAETPETIHGATQYMQILMLTFPANALSLAVTAVLRGIGKTRISMIYNVSANVVNLLIGFLFIEGKFGLPSLGILGAAWGMGLGQVAAMIIALVTIMRGADILQLRLRSLLTIDVNILLGVAKIGAPAMMEQLFMRTGQIMFTKVVASLGTDAFATHQIANNILSMTMMNGQSFGVAATSLLGQSMGRKRPDIGKAFVQVCRRYAMVISLAMGGGMFFFGEQLMAMYTDQTDVIVAGAMVLKIVALIQPLQSSQQTLAGALRGAGDTKAVALCTFLGIVLMRPIVSYSLLHFFDAGLLGVWLALVLDQSVRSCYTMWRFSSDKWKAIKV